MTDISLTPDLEQFVQACVESGRYESVDAVARTALERMRAQEAARTQFVRTLEAARAEGEQNGFLTIDEVESDIRAAVQEANIRKAS